MAEDDNQKSEEPTQRRLEEAEKKGQVVNSREVNNFFIILAFTLVLSWMMPGLMGETQDTLSRYLVAPHDIPFDADSLRSLAHSRGSRKISSCVTVHATDATTMARMTSQNI